MDTLRNNRIPFRNSLHNLSSLAEFILRGGILHRSDDYVTSINCNKEQGRPRRNEDERKTDERYVTRYVTKISEH